jgi:hypothetical protein
VFTLTIPNGEDCVTSLEELGGRNRVHCGDSMLVML